MGSSLLNLDIRTALQFFDEGVPESRYHATALVALVGEEMGIGLVARYFQDRGASTDVMAGPVTQGTQKGARLDRWLRVTQATDVTYYQVEIKNWSAHAIGGRPLRMDAPSEVIAAHKIERWNRQWDGRAFRDKPVIKFLIPMKPPATNAHVEPLICYWDAMHPTGGTEPLFSVELSGQHFPRAWVFSMSSFLRNMLAAGISRLPLDMPSATARLRWMNNLFSSG